MIDCILTFSFLISCSIGLILIGAPLSIAFQRPSINNRVVDVQRSRLCSHFSERDCVPTPSFSSRRHVLSKLLTAPILTSAGIVAISHPANAATPITLGESEGLGAIAQRAMRPKPPKLLRQKLDQDFAVLLMRSSYNALDQIDCVAMVSTPSEEDRYGLCC